MMNVLLYKYFVFPLFSLGSVLGQHSQHTFCHRASVVRDCLDAHVLLPTRKTDKWRSLGTKGLKKILDSHFISYIISPHAQATLNLEQSLANIRYLAQFTVSQLSSLRLHKGPSKGTIHVLPIHVVGVFQPPLVIKCKHLPRPPKSIT